MPDIERGDEILGRLEAGRHWRRRRRTIRPQEHLRLGRTSRHECLLEGVDVPHARLRAFFHLALGGGLFLDQACDLARGVAHVARNDGLLRTHHDAGRLEPELRTVGAVVALLGGAGVLVQVERVVGAGLHAGAAADAGVAVEIDDRVRPLVQGDDRADLDAGRLVAVIAAQHREVAPHLREGALLDVLHPGSEVSDRDLVFRLARHRARMAADALSMVDHETVGSHEAPGPAGNSCAEG